MGWRGLEALTTICHAMTNLRTAAALLSTLAVLSGCAGQRVALSQQDRASLASQPQIHLVHHDSQLIFSIESTGRTAAGVLFTPLLAAAFVMEGRALQRDLRLEDPAARVKERLGEALRARRAWTNVRVVAEPAPGSDPEALKRMFATGLVLDVQTRKWGLDNARVKYSALGRLVRLEDSALIWEAACEFIARKDEGAPAMETLTAEDGALLKARILEAAEGCAGQLAAWVIGRPGNR